MEGRRFEGEGTSRNVPRLAKRRAVGKSAAMSLEAGTIGVYVPR